MATKATKKASTKKAKPARSRKASKTTINKKVVTKVTTKNAKPGNKTSRKNTNRGTAKGSSMIRISRSSEAAISSISDWWNAEPPTRTLQNFLSDTKARILKEGKKCVDSVQARSRVKVRRRNMEKAALWLTFSLLVIAVTLAAFATFITIISLITK